MNILALTLHTLKSAQIWQDLSTEPGKTHEATSSHLTLLYSALSNIAYIVNTC